ncbi:MAG: cellulase-like family protein, partial [Victivallaceae bacterium]|nr:cellulase-like family protein [Victivallaceae bacterium]
MKPIPSHLPCRLTISFPVWALQNTEPGGAYADLDRFVREHVERGFNCIRFDDGAGLIHDAAGRLCRSVPIVEPYPGAMGEIRQSWCTGNGGECDLFGRLVALLEAAKKYDVFVILSSWYYLHTYWYCGDQLRNGELHALDPHERFRYFGEELDRILTELRHRGLLDRVAAAEVFNEADGLPFINGYDGVNHLSVEERRKFRAKHEAAIAF